MSEVKWVRGDGKVRWQPRLSDGRVLKYPGDPSWYWDWCGPEENRHPRTFRFRWQARRVARQGEKARQRRMNARLQRVDD